MIVRNLSALDPTHAWWVPATAAPMRDWPAAPGCRRGARYLIDADRCTPAASGFPAFETRAQCLRWIMEHRATLGRTLPGARVDAVPLDAWMLGMAIA